MLGLVLRPGKAAGLREVSADGMLVWGTRRPRLLRLGAEQV